MKKTVKKLTAVGLTLTSVMSLVACGSSNTSSSSSTTKEKTVAEKPSTIKIMVDSTVMTETQGQKAFNEQLNTALGLTVEITQPDHSGYYTSVSQAFNSDSTMPDVVILSSDYLALYAANGLLWNMTDAWETSETKASGRLISAADSIINGLMVTGQDGKKGLYSLALYRGNGCATYIQKSALETAGIDVSKIEGQTLDFATYYSYLKTITEKTGHYAISAPGFVSDEAPYLNYLPEFFQKAQYTFYADSTGKYVDGFSEQAMQDALQRIATAVKDGVIDKESNSQNTSQARTKFTSKDASTRSSVFTYWAGTWCNTLTTNLKTNGVDTDLIQLKPIKELGTYVERLSPSWAITSACKNPEGVFQYFIDKLLDGDTVQTLMTYGAEGTHWSTKAETVTLQGKEDAGTTYTEGTFHMLPNPEKPTALYSKNHIDPIISLASFSSTSVGSKGYATVPQLAIDSENAFSSECSQAVAVPMTEAMGEYIGDINSCRKSVVSKVALGEMTVAEGMAYYKTTVGTKVEEVLKSLNK